MLPTDVMEGACAVPVPVLERGLVPRVGWSVLRCWQHATVPKQRPVTVEVQMNRNVYKRQPKGAAPDARAALLH